MAELEIPVFLGKVDDRRHGPDGMPLWPVTGTAQADRLTALAATHGARLRWSAVVPSEPVEPVGTVYGAGAGTEQAARLYAHLTDREYAGQVPVEGVTRDLRADVVVTWTEHVEDRLLDRLYPRGVAPDHVTGLVCGDGPGELHDQVLLRAAAARLPATPAPRQVEFHPLARLAVPEDGPEHVVLDGASPASDVRAALASGADLLYASTHSDGIDAFLGPELTLCSVRAGAHGDGDRAPYCVQQRTCHRRRLPLDEALADGGLAAPSLFAARIMMWYCCYGILPTTGPLSDTLDRRWGLLPALLANPRVGVLATTWEITIANAERPAGDMPFVAALRQGATIGEAVVAQHAEAAAGRGVPRVCVIGDPSVRLVPATGAVEVAPAPEEAPVPSGPAGPGPSIVTAVLQYQLSTGSPELQDSVLDVLDALDQTDDDAVARRVVVDHLVAHNRAVQADVLPFARVVPMRDAGDCPGCGRQTNGYHLVAERLGNQVRTQRMCPGCGLLDNVPAGVDAGVWFAGGVFHLRPLPGRTDWAGGLILGSSLPSVFASWSWPSAPDGTPATEFAPPGPWPPGPLRAMAYLLYGRDELLMLHCPARAEGLSAQAS